MSNKKQTNEVTHAPAPKNINTNPGTANSSKSKANPARNHIMAGFEKIVDKSITLYFNSK